MPAGYSKRSLADKLGLKPAQRACFVRMPASVKRELGALPEDLELVATPRGELDFVHAFFDASGQLARELPRLRKLLADDGMIWISWPKKSSGVKTDITEDVVRALALAQALVDVKVCAVDETWSGLKLVVPVRSRGSVESSAARRPRRRAAR